MDSGEPDNRTWRYYLRRLVSGFSFELLPLLVDVAHDIAQWIGDRHAGLYDIVAYESTLELADGAGKLATVSKRQRIRFLQNDITAFEDIVYGDGKIFSGYEVSPGVAADYYQDGDRWHVLISLRSTKNRGDEEEFLLKRTIENGFIGEEEWWQVELRHPTRSLRLTIIFPKERAYRRISLTQRSRHRTWTPGPECFSTLPDGRQQVRWQAQNVRPLEVYTVRWSW